MGSVNELAVVFVAFDGVQPIDVAGPHEVFANAGDAAASLGRHGGYQVRVASPRGGLTAAAARHRGYVGVPLASPVNAPMYFTKSSSPCGDPIS